MFGIFSFLAFRLLLMSLFSFSSFALYVLELCAIDLCLKFIMPLVLEMLLFSIWYIIYILKNGER
jgi:hypothetical protein